MAVYILGGGTSSFLIAKSLRSKGYAQVIHILSIERWLPYNRMQLPHFLRGKIPVNRVFFSDKNWYEQQEIRLYGGIKAEFTGPSISLTRVENQDISIDGLEGDFLAPIVDSEVLGKLQEAINSSDNTVIWACGGSPAIPKEYEAYRNRILTWRTLEDTQAIRKLLSGNSKVGIIGGSFIGIELATSANALNPDNKYWLIRDKSFIRSGLHTDFQTILEDKWANFSSIRPRLGTWIDSAGSSSSSSLVLNSAEILQLDAIILGTGLTPNVPCANQPSSFLVQSDRLQNPNQCVAGDLLQLHLPELSQPAKCGSYHQASHIADQLAQFILSGTQPQVQDFRNILNTPYQIQFAGKSLRASGQILKSELATKFMVSDREARQVWYDLEGMEAGYIAFSL